MTPYCAAAPIRKRVTIPIARVTSLSSSTGGTQPAVNFYIRTPSARLAMRVAIQCPNPADPTKPPSATSVQLASAGPLVSNWQATPQIDQTDGAGGLQPPWTIPMSLQPAFVDSAGTAAPRTLPDGFEYQGPVQLWRFDCNLLVWVANASRPIVYADITWEPGPGGDIDQDQLAELFNRCNVFGSAADGASIVGYAPP